MTRILIATLALFTSLALHAAGNPKTAAAEKASNLTKDQREAMAKVHEQMATCLRSDKSVDACHDEMRQACKTNDACPMMKGSMGMHRKE